MKPIAKIPLPFDRFDKVNTGVTGLYAVSFNNTAGDMLMVEYTASGKGMGASLIAQQIGACMTAAAYNFVRAVRKNRQKLPAQRNTS